MHHEAGSLSRIWFIQWASFFLFVVGAAVVIAIPLPALWGFIPGGVAAAWALFAFVRQQYALGVLVALLTVLLFASLFGAIRSRATHFLMVPGDGLVSVGDTVPVTNITDGHRIGRD